MNPQFRNVALIAAALGLLVSLFFALRTDDDEPAATTAASPTATAPPAATAEPTAAPTAEPTPPPATTGEGPETVNLDYTVEGGQPVGGISRDTVEEGNSVVIRVTSDVADEVHLHGYDLSADVAPGSPATIQFTADVPGRFEIELEDLGVQIAELEVRP
jgi:hypothetical protein